MLHTATLIYWISITIFSTLGVIVGIRLYNNLNNEKHREQGKVIQRIMKTYAIMQCIAWPCIMIFLGLLLIDKFVTHICPLSLQRNAIIAWRYFIYYILHNINSNFNTSLKRPSLSTIRKQVIHQLWKCWIVECRKN